MKRFLLRDVLGFGFLLWLFGYVLGFVFFALLPPAQLGWAIMPFGIAATLFVLWKYARFENLNAAIALAIGWTVIAAICDYFLLVKVLHPADGYYKLDVYLYYFLTFFIPLGWYFWRQHKA